MQKLSMFLKLSLWIVVSLLLANELAAQSRPISTSVSKSPAFERGSIAMASRSMIKKLVKGDKVSDLPGYDPAKPWVFWYWMNASVSKEGIYRDLVAMQQQGICGAYLMCIYGSGKMDTLMTQPPAEQLSPEWWQLIHYAFQVADSLGLKLAMHVGDGFATAGGPWITDALSMQKVVWSKTVVEGNRQIRMKLPVSGAIRGNYYKDIAVYAFPTPNYQGAENSTLKTRPVVTTNADDPHPERLLQPSNTATFSSKKPCWITYSFDKPFTCRSIEIKIGVVNQQAKRLQVWTSQDGKVFKFYTQLQPSRSGWQDYEMPITYSVPAITAKYFRFVYDPEGTEPGSEDLDDAKWSPRLKVAAISLFSNARINQYEGKSGLIWRVAKRTDATTLPDSVCIDTARLLNITDHLDAAGNLAWDAPKGRWTILRMGHSSTGKTNATAGGGQGLECDKFNPVAVKLQFDHWFGEVAKKMGPDLATHVLKIFHVDSWECGSQNWSPVFRTAFIKMHGYDPIKMLPVMAGLPVGSARSSESFLYDIRQTIAELLNENFFGTLAEAAHQQGCLFSAECTAPVMVSDGMRHFDKVDIPMGEFWLRSPTHDKPNDILDAISGGHIYGKKIIQSEAFTELRNKWDEYPGMLKALQDHHYAMGINRFVFHVFTENPWLDRKPGMTLSGVGLYFQRDQTWWPMAKGWMDYTRRSQEILQKGVPVTDIAVYNGAEIPSRAILPDRLLPTLPGIFGALRVNNEVKRLANKGNPLQHIPEKVTSLATITTAKDWVDPLHGYKYDAINTDALLRLAKVNNGRIVLPGGASYGLLVLPKLDKMDPNNTYLPTPLAEKLLALVRGGGILLLDRYPTAIPGRSGERKGDVYLQKLMDTLMGGRYTTLQHPAPGTQRRLGKGTVLFGPYLKTDFSSINLPRDFQVRSLDGKPAGGIAWNHRELRSGKEAPQTEVDQKIAGLSGIRDIYFVSNQQNTERNLTITLRSKATEVFLYDAVTNQLNQQQIVDVQPKNGRSDQHIPIQLRLNLPASGSVFILLRPKVKQLNGGQVPPRIAHTVGKPKVLKTLSGNENWSVQFDTAKGGPAAAIKMTTLTDWRFMRDTSLRHYSGTALYKLSFVWNGDTKIEKNNNSSYTDLYLNLGIVNNIAAVKLNGKDCGVAWTAPMRVNITGALKKGHNELEIQVANTWANRLIGDHALPLNKRRTFTTAPFNLDGHDLLPAGLLGPVQIMEE
ncbi:MAG TPA: glycosyl hydrolase [Arachidicoccus sp.]|nr:glycosyl hydrolase [Arachidicoccus sp.]